MLCYITSVMLCYVMLYNICHVVKYSFDQFFFQFIWEFILNTAPQGSNSVNDRKNVMLCYNICYVVL